MRALIEAGDPAEPAMALLHVIADRIRNHCGHAALKAHRLSRGWTVDGAIRSFHAMCRKEELGPRGLSERSWLGWEAGSRPNDDYRDLLCRLFQTSAVRLGFASDYTPDSPAPHEVVSDHDDLVPDSGGRPRTLVRLKKLREGVDEVVGGGAMSEASIEDWEATALRLGAATRYRSSGPLLDEMTADFVELQRKLARRQPLTALRRLTVVAAQMAGLMSLTLLKLNENAESRHWARTARIAADETGEAGVRSWFGLRRLTPITTEARSAPPSMAPDRRRR